MWITMWKLDFPTVLPVDNFVDNLNFYPQEKFLIVEN